MRRTTPLTPPTPHPPPSTIGSLHPALAHSYIQLRTDHAPQRHPRHLLAARMPEQQSLTSEAHSRLQPDTGHTPLQRRDTHLLQGENQ